MNAPFPAPAQADAPLPPPPDSAPRGLAFATQLFLLLVIPIGVLALAIAFTSLEMHDNAMRTLVGERDRRAVTAAAGALQEQLTHRAAAIHSLALVSALAPSPAVALEAYAFQASDFEGGWALYDQAGKVEAASNGPEAWAARPVPGLLAALAGATEPQYSAAFRDPTTGEWLVLVGAQGQGELVAIGAFSPAVLVSQAAEALLIPPSGAEVWVVDPAGQILYGAGPVGPERDPLQHPGVAEAQRGEAGATYIATQGTEHVVAYAPVAPVGWVLLIEEPWEAVDNPLLRRTQLAPLVLVPVLVFALLLVWLGLRHIVQPLRALAEQSRELGQGRYDSIVQPVGGIREIRHLQAELVRMAGQVQTAEHSLRRYAARVTHGQEDERRRLARELHDQTIQSLIALDQRVQMTQHEQSPTALASAERLAELRRMIAGLLDDVRRVIQALRPIYLEDLGLLPALEMLTHDLEQTAGVPARFVVAGRPARLSPEHEITIYRLAQEALSNVARHAQAKQVVVTAGFAPTEFVLQVQDDGRGFRVPERTGDLAAAGHFGLLGMYERAELAGGQLLLASAPSQGTRLSLHLPL